MSILVSMMDALSDQFRSGHFVFGDTPNDCESSVGADYENSRLSASWKGNKGNFCCSDSIRNHEHEDFLEKLSELDHYKSDNMGFSTTNHEDNGLLWGEDLDIMEFIGRSEQPEFTMGVDSDGFLSNSNAGLQDEADLVEHASSMVDWEAWNCYLSCENDLNCGDYTRDQYVGPVPLNRNTFGDICRRKASDSDHSDVCKCDPMVSNYPLKESMISRIVVPKSGPLTWLPFMRDEYDHDNLYICKRSSASTKILKCDMKMKPLGGNTTNHRRLLNREAAFRYRQRKRVKQIERKRELEHLINQNRTLRLTIRLLRTEITSLKEKIIKSKST